MGKKIIMSWSKCKIEVGKTGDDEAMAASLTDIGTINDKSTTLATEDGETLTATATGVLRRQDRHVYSENFRRTCALLHSLARRS